MEELKNAIMQILAQSRDCDFQTLMQRFCDALSQHPEVLGELAGSYRLKTEDTGFDLGFELSEGGMRVLGPGEKADATVTGKEENLLGLIRKDINPMYAMFTGKVSIKGSMQALQKFSQLVM